MGASCALCCGSHNYRGSREDIAALFARRAERVRDFSRGYILNRILSSRSDMTGSYYFRSPDLDLEGAIPPLFPDLPRCEYVGGEGGTVRCLLAGGEAERAECPLAYGGKHWTCPARDNCAPDEIEYAARLAGDWYYYAALIHSPGELRALMARHERPDDVPADVLASLRKRLDARVREDGSLHSIHGYFG